MKSFFFTKPKEMTLECLKFLIAQGEELLGVILDGKEQYASTDFIRLCETHSVPVYDVAEAGDCFARHAGRVEMLYCNTFPKRIRVEWIRAAKIAAINFHAAPLPEYRGVFGYNFAFLNRESSYGVTCHYLSPDFDAGDIIEIVRFPYDFEHGCIRELVAVSERQMLELFQKIYLRFRSGERVTGAPQLGGRYYSRKDFEREKEILPTDTPETVCARVRAFWYPPYDGAYVMCGNEKFYLMGEVGRKELFGK